MDKFSFDAVIDDKLYAFERSGTERGCTLLAGVIGNAVEMVHFGVGKGYRLGYLSIDAICKSEQWMLIIVCFQWS